MHLLLHTKISPERLPLHNNQSDNHSIKLRTHTHNVPDEGVKSYNPYKIKGNVHVGSTAFTLEFTKKHVFVTNNLKQNEAYSASEESTNNGK